MAEIFGGAVVAKMLRKEGVEQFFGIIDGTYNHLFISAVDEGLKMITPRHETVAAHMAGAYARVTGKLGVFLASNGPGVANVLSGAVIEHLEGNRVLLITSARRRGVTDPDRPGAYQAFDQHKVIRDFAKWSVYIRDFERIPGQMQEAFRRCFSGRPGLVHVDIPEDIINSAGPEPAFLEPAQYRPLTPPKACQDEVRAAARMLAEAEMPMIQAGSGVIHALAFSELKEVAELLNAPITASWAADSVLPHNLPFICPMGLNEMVNGIRNAADLCLCLGSSMGETDWWGKAPYWALPEKQKFIQVDLEASVIGRNRQVDMAVVADIKSFLTDLAAELKKLDSGAGKPGRLAILQKIGEAKQMGQKAVGEGIAAMPASPVHALHAAVSLRQILPADTIFVLDGGNTVLWGSFISCLAPNTRLSTWHMGHLGSGQGYALGAAAARPATKVCLFTGDGAMGFHMQELETAVRYGLNIMFVIVADKQWGMVKINQMVNMEQHKERYPNALKATGCVNTDLGPIAWAELAKAVGMPGENAKTVEEFQAAAARFAALKGPSLIQIDVDPVAHMRCPVLKIFKDMHNEPAGR